MLNRMDKQYRQPWEWMVMVILLAAGFACLSYGMTCNAGYWGHMIIGFLLALNTVGLALSIIKLIREQGN